ncbi:MAG TPA: ATP-binding protein [Azospirillaceae bacterium]|nr:ATP-binding protein [Azospirillaceae bacterium]
MTDAPVIIARTKEEILDELEGAGLLEPSWSDLEDKTRELERSQTFIEDVLESMSDILVVSDRQGLIRKVNRAVLELTGFAEPELIGQPLSSLFLGDFRVDIGQCAANCDCPEAMRKALQDCEVRLRDRLGRPTEPVTLSCQARRGAVAGCGAPEGLVIIGRPAGELRRAYEALARTHRELVQAQERLVQTEKMASIGRLVAGVAHELNNPVSFVYGNVLALARYRERLERYVHAIHDSELAAEFDALRRDLRIDRIFRDLPSLVDGTVEGAQRIRDIVRDLLTLSYHDTSPPDRVELAPLAATAADWVAREPGWPARVGLTVTVPPGLAVAGRNGRLHQVLVNLLKNAADAVAAVDGPGITVTGAVDGGTALLSVRDNGPGIPAEALGKLFDPFFTTKPVGKGTGLGLWVSYEIARDHGGVIEAHNLAQGGAGFILKLPLAS